MSDEGVKKTGARESRREKKLANYAHLGDVGLDITVELGRKEMPLKEANRLREGETVVLDKLAGEAMEVRVNGRLFAMGEIVVVTDQKACRLTQLV